MIRKAEPTDAAFAAPLIYEAIGDIANMLTGAEEADEAIRMMAEFFAQKNNRLSYENALIAMDEGVPVGLALFYHGSQTERLDRPFVDHVQRLTGEAPSFVKEAKDNEFYLDTVVVSSACRGKGIGKKLLEAFEKEGEQRGYDRVALLVDEENGRARQLYEAIGYRQDGTILLNGHLFSHMIKELTVLV
ncbi:N-acetyltransferase [Brevibacillus reuszeri]|uniref:Acetyltransferase n=1 Tax=Brevibacillus reuszeri TaxID=54915 RepID=A0A0K9YZ07_9BACL|nr:GNAT family N-acetyltransferase [Brevibacillus reuszeri]KNB73968.1 acetyltransferase [Brevibacillus reuszeri]MED1859871.1 GNAT family N-acetyltransferase [Brevibacillus reuszeri]GED70946.1 N-acetyltransferase [Brevibacillus reuszeri]